MLRRRALVGDMLSHAALPGICIAFLIMGKRNLIGLSLGALATGLLGIGLVTLIRRWTRTKEDAAIGIVLSTFFGAGIVLLSIIQQQPSGNQAGLNSYLFGETAGITRHDIRLIAAVACICLVIVALLYKEFELLSFDPDFATAQGWPTLALDLLMMGTLAVVTIVGLPLCGVILMAALIILPGAAARFWTNRSGADCCSCRDRRRGRRRARHISRLAAAAALVRRRTVRHQQTAARAADRAVGRGVLFVFAAVRAASAASWPDRLPKCACDSASSASTCSAGCTNSASRNLPERPYIDESQLLAQRSLERLAGAIGGCAGCEPAV